VAARDAARLASLKDLRASLDLHWQSITRQW
jgi:hypothetical protein